MTNIDITLADRLMDHLVEAWMSKKAEVPRLEKGLGTAEGLVSNMNEGTIRKLVRLLSGSAGADYLLLKVKRYVAKSLLDVADDFLFGFGGEDIASLHEYFQHVIAQIATSHIGTHDRVWHRVALVDGHGVGNTISSIEHETSGAAGGVEGQHGLDSYVKGRDVESFKHNLGHSLAVLFGISWGFGEHNAVGVGGGTQLAVVGVTPYLLHFGPVCNNAALDGVAKSEDTTAGLGIITDVVVLCHGNPTTRLGRRAANDGGEDAAGGFLAREASPGHTGTTIAHNGALFLIHFV